MERISKAFSFEGVDWPKIGRGALVAIVGAVIVWLPTVITGNDFGVWTPFVTALAAIIVNVGRKFVSENQ